MVVTATQKATVLPTISAAEVLNPTADSTAQAFLLDAPTFAVPTVLPASTIPSTVFLPSVPSSTPSNTPAPPSTPLPGAPTVTPGGAAGVPLGEPLDVGNGEMRVLTAARPGDSLITEMGGSAANPPSGQEWVVIEGLVICSGTDNCAPDMTELRIVGSSGTPYSLSPNFSMPQLFGPDGFSLGQVWGYMAFTVPTSENDLRLVLTKNGQSYVFALE
jgi:hypothetical protein